MQVFRQKVMRASDRRTVWREGVSEVLVEFSDSKAELRLSWREAACSAKGAHCMPALARCFMKCFLLKSIKCWR